MSDVFAQEAAAHGSPASTFRAVLDDTRDLLLNCLRYKGDYDRLTAQALTDSIENALQGTSAHRALLSDVREALIAKLLFADDASEHAAALQAEAIYDVLNDTVADTLKPENGEGP